ncbi:MAG TPA: type II toxin-antitoxin system RelE/ParE family toxin [Phenylobacterium sp.]|uniref:type II toxin-antitoxin system RelE/ParE family toxin n=1 Tax=Phenylobacterium sp. TaxID=1871053 RepID=UPI002B815E1C|nr:type II toxin-antitoxin system RelE/ParE family toxin [Phenylobacterium sp.]HSV02439.1 type II toxin-antitoxin system RelE/ParE family toxin [Phenylobacterium sp.]
MIEVTETDDYRDWMFALRDRRAAARIEVRISRLRMGNPGDVGPVGGGVSEMRIHYGPGYRVYYAERGSEVVLPLCGGDKSTQRDDIDRAKALAKEWENGA